MYANRYRPVNCLVRYTRDRITPAAITPAAKRGIGSTTRELQSNLGSAENLIGNAHHMRLASALPNHEQLPAKRLIERD